MDLLGDLADLNKLAHRISMLACGLHTYPRRIRRRRRPRARSFVRYPGPIAAPRTQSWTVVRGIRCARANAVGEPRYGLRASQSRNFTRWEARRPGTEDDFRRLRARRTPRPERSTFASPQHPHAVRGQTRVAAEDRQLLSQRLRD